MKLFGFIDCDLKKNWTQVDHFIFIMLGVGLILLIEYLLTGKTSMPFQSILGK